MTTLDTPMAAAMRLTRAGKLTEATGLIQALLARRAPADGPVPFATPGDAIDITPTRVTVSPKVARDAGEDRTGTFVERRHDGAAGSLDYRLYLPMGAQAGMPVVIMLHGCTQNPEDFARGTGMNRLADELGVIIAYPRQKQAANAQKCWNWFRPGDQQRDRGEPALIAGIARDILRDEQADATRVYIAGLSAGGAAAANVAALYPDLFAAVGIHSGLACGAARDLPSALAAMQRGGGASSIAFVPAIVFHGDRDTTVNEINAREIVNAVAKALGRPLETRVETGRSPGGRRYTRDCHVDGAGRVLIEQWRIHGAGHAWAGGDAGGSYTDPSGPDASREMLRFFLGHAQAKEGRPA